ncbi:chemotaxis protein MotB [Aquamicrobium defluvii]|uniref:Chemotaxis protein MotB n=2 Tax=Aquamicrobium defluvii TaxID=69279 RepID=A0A4R6YE47_9HYPH|nr:chemotaxis protein MotB [Aquamicrobium defluvii]
MVGRLVRDRVMSDTEATAPRQEIIIVRRRHDEEEAHHGGVWKIAFADFMTAMMCFFLVMWLINAANEETRAAVASYFNPIKLIDRNSSRKGLEDLGEGPASSGRAESDPLEALARTGTDGQGNAGSVAEQNELEKAGAHTLSPDEQLFANPYAVLAEIAADSGRLQNVSEKGDGGAQNSGPSSGASGGEFYRDPFAPDFWSQQMTVPPGEASAERAKSGEETVAHASQEETQQETAPHTDPESPARQVEASSGGEATNAGEGSPEPHRQEDRSEIIPPDAKARQTASEIRQQIAQAFGSGDKIGEGISVEATGRGVVLTITDQLDFGMFEIGSALPRRELVLAMEKIGRILREKEGLLSIQGHTDARPFRSATYDNWRLSTARAHAAYYMLVRGGMDEARIREVSGFADREPRNKADPMAAVNRRIAILLETQP